MVSSLWGFTESEWSFKTTVHKLSCKCAYRIRLTTSTEYSLLQNLSHIYESLTFDFRICEINYSVCVISPILNTHLYLISTFEFLTITKTCLYNFDPLKHHFYIVKLGLQGYTLFFLFLLKNIDCGYSLEPPRRGGSNEYPQSMF